MPLFAKYCNLTSLYTTGDCYGVDTVLVSFVQLNSHKQEDEDYMLCVAEK